MTDPLISIITPSFNQAAFIEDTLDSVRNQTYSNVEHIVMDGESTDGTIEILKEYESQYNLTWISEPDDGQSDAINKGFERASGDIVAWLNSDDTYFDTNVLSRVATYFDRFDAEIIYGDLVYIDEQSNVTAVDIRPEFDIDKLPYRILIGQPATFFRRAVVVDEKLDTDLQYSMDYEYWLRLAQKYEFRHVQDILAGFRSYSAQKSADQEAMADELEEILTQYSTDQQGISTVVDNIGTEAKRLLTALIITYQLHRNPPEFAFNGRFTSLWTMINHLGPATEDVLKAWRRWRTKGASG